MYPRHIKNAAIQAIDQFVKSAYATKESGAVDTARKLIKSKLKDKLKRKPVSRTREIAKGLISRAKKNLDKKLTITPKGLLLSSGAIGAGGMIHDYLAEQAERKKKKAEIISSFKKK